MQTGIKSQSAARTIRQFLLACIPTINDETGSASESDADPETLDMDPLEADDVRYMLRDVLENTQDTKDSVEEEQTTDNRYKSELAQTKKLFGVALQEPTVLGPRVPENVLSSGQEDNPALIAEAKQLNRGVEERLPFTGATMPEVHRYSYPAFEQQIITTLQKIQSGTPAPTTAQMDIIRRWGARLIVEHDEEKRGIRYVETSNLEPLMEWLHGPPGTGKSLLLNKVRELFEAVGMKNGTHYVTLAFLNQVASDNDGQTVHSWSGLPIDIGSGEVAT